MHDKLNTLYELCETLTEELEELNDKIQKADGMSAGDLETVDKLSHALKSIKTTVAMMEADDDYSHNYGRSYASGGNRGGGSSYRGNSYARGGRGGRNNNPTGRNQYSRNNGYSYDDGMEELISEMRGMMGELPEEKRREVERFVNKMERM